MSQYQSSRDTDKNSDTLDRTVRPEFHGQYCVRGYGPRISPQNSNERSEKIAFSVNKTVSKLQKLTNKTNKYHDKILLFASRLQFKWVLNRDSSSLIRIL